MKLALVLVLTLMQQVAPRPDRVEVSPAEVTLDVDATQQFTATAYDADGNRLDADVVRWFSTDSEVVAIDSTGRATALRPGTMRLAAVVQGRPGYATVTVNQLPPAKLAARLPVEAVLVGTSVPIHATARTRLNDVLERPGVRYASSDPQVAAVDAEGRIVGMKPGAAVIRAMTGDVSTSLEVRVVENTAVTYEIEPQLDAPVRTGDVVRFLVRAKDAGGKEVFGLRPAWSIGSSGAQVETEGEQGLFVAEEPGTYRVTAVVGPEVVRSITIEVEPRTHTARLETVGRGPITSHSSADTWVFEGVDGRDYAYIGTYMYDWMMAWDVTDPENPVLTDSVQVDARRINDVKIHPNNRIAIITREGASSRRNGIVLLDLSTPAHPTILSEYTDTVTGGVHNVWIWGEEDLVYAVHNGTRDIHIIDISDPKNPKQVGHWGLDKQNKSLHDVIVQDGYAYLSYWDDGLIILDAGAGTHGGTPTTPVFVSQIKYPGGNTHTAWRDGDYVFVGDEIFPNEWTHTAPIEARGYIHVMDVSDIENPREVAKYEVPEAGAHNVWVEDDKLYIGYYQGGLRVVDISGELRGDLYQQGREIAALKTTDANAFVPNWPMTFSAQIFKGLIYSADFNSGLWITRLVEDEVMP